MTENDATTLENDVITFWNDAKAVEINIKTVLKLHQKPENDPVTAKTDGITADIGG